MTGSSLFRNGNEFTLNSTFSPVTGSGNSSCLKVTGNGNFVLWATDDKISVYQKNQSNKKFELLNQLVDGTTTVRTCDITDDG